MKIKLFLIIIVICMSFSLVHAEDSIIAGNDLKQNTLNEESISLNEELLNYQENNAVNNVQLGTEEISISVRKKQILEDASYMWSLIGGLLYIFMNLLKIILYLIEMYVFTYFFFKLIPNVLIKSKEKIQTWYQNK